VDGRDGTRDGGVMLGAVTNDLRSFLDKTLRATAPATVEALAAAAVQTGCSRARSPAGAVLRVLQGSAQAVALPDGRWTHALVLLEGATLTHRPRYATDGRTALWPRGDLVPFHRLFGAPVPLAAGGTVALSAADARGQHARPPTWVGPPGWLPAVPAGALLALTLSGGALSVHHAEVDPDAVAGRVDLLRATVEHHLPARSLRGAPAYGDDRQSRFLLGLLGALVEVPDLLAVPLLPLDQVFPDLGGRPGEPDLEDVVPCGCRWGSTRHPGWEDDVSRPLGSGEDAVVHHLFDGPLRR